MKVLVTGANGFLGKNLHLHLTERKDVQVVCFNREHSAAQLPALLQDVDFVFHLAGVNRSEDPQKFTSGNANLTRTLCEALANITASTGKRVPVVYTSSTQAVRHNPYGISKRAAEEAILSLRGSSGNLVHVFRLPNVFGKWCKPDYNSAVATFCYNIARGLPIQINDPAAPVTLVYVDDVIRCFIQLMDGADATVDSRGFATVSPQYITTVGELAGLIQMFKDSRQTLMTERVGVGLLRALYATYVSYLPVGNFSYAVPVHSDKRGVFVEMLKTPDAGQFSFFTAHPGITRGGHYHNTKTEKFLVIKGHARFGFRHILTNELYILETRGEQPQIVESVPGWSHDITNIGNEEMVVMLWANEIFDHANPDTIISKV
jgi:UDP-2-acetamido-2,6-beta-L-arabino-hexul-4-ose reductase